MSTVTLEQKTTTMTIETTLDDDIPTKAPDSCLENGDSPTTGKSTTSPETNDTDAKPSKDTEESQQVTENGSEKEKSSDEESGAKPKDDDGTEDACKEEAVDTDQAVLTNFLPEDKFECCLGDDCLVGDKTATEGK